MKGKMCCNRFDCLGEEVDDVGPGNPSLNVNVERASSGIKMEFEEKTIPLMGSGKAVKGQGAVQGQSKKTLVKGKGPVTGNLVKSGKTYA